MWGCYVHNIVNKRLKKPEFNCEDIGDAYDCGMWMFQCVQITCGVLIGLTGCAEE